MNVSDLQKFLAAAKRKHGDVEIAFELHSDIAMMPLEQLRVMRGVPRLHGEEGWITRFHDSMTEEQKARAKTYVLFPGN